MGAEPARTGPAPDSAGQPGEVADGTAPDPQRQLVLGLVASPGLTQDVALHLASALPDRLRARFPGTEWRVEVRSEVLAGAPGVDLVQLARQQLLEQGWQFAVCLTDLPLSVGRRPATAHASLALGIGVVSVPALGAVAVDERALDAVLRIVDMLLGGHAPLRESATGENRRRMRLRVRRRLHEIHELSSPVGRLDVPAQDTVRFVTATGQGNLRLLVGMVRANRPWRVVVSLSRAVVGALGAGAFGLTSPPVWWIADALHGPRVAVMALSSVLALSLTLIVSHRLLERSPSRDARARVSLINVSTVLTVVIGVVTLFVGLLSITVACGTAFIPAEVLQRQLQHPVSVRNYLGIGWVVSSLATLGGALGAALESDVTVREAAFGYRPTERSSPQQ
jgi:hypothetical protein